MSKEEASIEDTDNMRNTGNLRTFVRTPLPFFPFGNFSHTISQLFLLHRHHWLVNVKTHPQDHYGVPCASKLLDPYSDSYPGSLHLSVSETTLAQTCLTPACRIKPQWVVTLPIHPELSGIWLLFLLTSLKLPHSLGCLSVISCWIGIWSPTHRDVPQMAWVVPTPVQKNYTAINFALKPVSRQSSWLSLGNSYHVI